MDKDILTPKQRFVFEKIKLYKSKNKNSPSVRDLCFLCDIGSTATMFVHLQKIKAKGYIDFEERKARTIRILKEI